MNAMKKNRMSDTENGSILVWTVVMLALLIAFAALATDIPYLYDARRQAQTAADAGALAGAQGLFVGQAEADAKVVVGKTPIIGQLLTASQIDVFTCNSNGGSISECLTNTPNPDQVTCVTHRDVARGNPLPLFLMPILQLFGLGPATTTSSGWNLANVSATATARLLTACSGACVPPWSVADRWVDTNGDGDFDDSIDQYDPVATGYQYPADIGLQVTLKVGNPVKAIEPGFFYAVDLPPLNRGTPGTGGDQYRENISQCNPESFVAVGDQLQVEPGNMVGPTKQGVQDIIAQDPSAYWDAGCNCARSPLGTNSPRLRPFAFFDPRLPVDSGRNYVTVIKVGGFFIEGLQGNDVVGRFTPVAAKGGTADPACGPGLLKPALVT